MTQGYIKGESTSTLNSSAALEEFCFHLATVHLEKKARIRPYQEADRPAICQLCCETGFLGNPVDPLFQDRQLFADLFTKAYLDYEPEWALVAEVDGRLIGYLLGSVSRHFDLLLMRSGFETTLKMCWRLATGRYAQHPRSRQFIRWLLTAAFREQPSHPAGAAHLHFDLERHFRGRGIGRRLWEVYEQKLQGAGVTRCYGAFFSHSKRRPEAAYARYGFSVFDRRRTTIFEPELTGLVEVVCVQKQIGAS
ncbi:MAG TPA: GNAT family N-acetyltransferase [Bacillota bacterium]|nr:GNAT family N-acetyltransferase [Bacillota bacterium]